MEFLATGGARHFGVVCVMLDKLIRNTESCDECKYTLATLKEHPHIRRQLEEDGVVCGGVNRLIQHIDGSVPQTMCRCVMHDTSRVRRLYNFLLHANSDTCGLCKYAANKLLTDVHIRDELNRFESVYPLGSRGALACSVHPPAPPMP